MWMAAEVEEVVSQWDFGRQRANLDNMTCLQLFQGLSRQCANSIHSEETAVWTAELVGVPWGTSDPVAVPASLRNLRSDQHLAD